MNQQSSGISMSMHNEANISNEILFNEFYKALVRKFGDIILYETENSTTQLQQARLLFWGLINSTWAPIRRAGRFTEGELDEYDAYFDKVPINRNEAKDQLFALVEYASRAGILVSLQYSMTDYDDVLTPSNKIINEVR